MESIFQGLGRIFFKHGILLLDNGEPSWWLEKKQSLKVKNENGVTSTIRRSSFLQGQ
jgi:hypothetical protein